MNRAHLTIAILCCGSMMSCNDIPGGMRPSYKATDHDRRLTPIARSASATITALRKHYAEHSTYPVALDDLEPLPPEKSLAGDGQHSWLYRRHDLGTGFTLWYKLGWDPALIYECDGVIGHWIFDPGDGSPQKTLALD
ncbi:MAG TPA: hypothetical protein VEZ11_18460 [Thermoanaerobaculia bacterium]|nr:hypothetical protein [Thermoanaerobaculia bacterium]